MSAHCHDCGSDMGYGIEGVPVCSYCEVKAENVRLRKALFAVRALIEPSNPCHFELREVLLDALGPDAATDAKRGPGE